MKRTRIVIFAKAPVPGEVKTRLIPALGPEGAAKLAGEMMHSTCEQALISGLGPVELCLAGHPDWTGDLPAGVPVTDQGSGDLGERLVLAARIDGAGWRETVRMTLGVPFRTHGTGLALISAEPGKMAVAPPAPPASLFGFEPR